MAFLIPQNLRSRADIPRPVRDVATAFQIALDDSSTVWFEPRYDPESDKPHLVLRIPDYGIAVVEVFETKTADVLGEVRGKLRVQRDGREVEVTHPLERAERLADTIKLRVAAELRLDGIEVAVAAIAALPGIDREQALEKGLETLFDVECCLFRHEIDAARAGSGDATMLRFLARLLGAHEPIETHLEDVVRGLIQPEIVIDPASGEDQLVIFPAPRADELVRVMDRKQEALAKSLGEGHRVIRGVAGSGKTLVLVFRARLMAEWFPQQKFLVTCYTRSMASQLRAYLGDYDNIVIQNLDALMAKAAGQAGLALPPFSADPSGEARAEVALEALGRGALTRYRGVFIDEAQDFSTSALRFAVGLLDERYDDLMVVADAAQNIFRRKFTWKAAGINAVGRRTRTLDVNYRNTKETVELAAAFLLQDAKLSTAATPDLEDENTIVPPEKAVRNGPLPTVSIVVDEESIHLVVRQVEALLQRAQAPRGIAVLYLNGWEGQHLRDALAAAHVDHFWVTDPAAPDNKNIVAQAEEPVILSTVHSAKGLEFRHVVLCCDPGQDQDLDELRRTVYVGMTRAIEQLLVIATTGHPLVEALEVAARDRARLRRTSVEPAA